MLHYWSKGSTSGLCSHTEQLHQVCCHHDYINTVFLIVSFLQSSPNPSKDVPGYRKILPRADYLLLSKGCSSNQPLGSPESEVCVDSTVDSILPSVTVTQGFTPLGLTSEVEHSEQAAVLDDITEETVLASYPADPQEITSISSFSLTSKAQSSMDTCVDQDPNLAVTVVTLKGNKSVADSGSADSMLLQKLEEPAQMVALIPAPVRLTILNHFNQNIVLFIMQSCYLSLTAEPARAHLCARF